MENLDLVCMITEGSALLASPMRLGPLTEGHYITIGCNVGFYLPELDFQAAQSRANELRKIQFLGLTRDGEILSGTREEILEHPDSAGVVAWVLPK